MGVPLKALVIDDSGVMRKMVMKSLTETNLADLEFIEAEDGVDALAKLKTNEVDIAFVDWNMPNMTGVDFVKEVRKEEKFNDREGIPLVMVTSEKTIAKMQEALDEAGADGFISKPFTVQEMQHKLKKHVDKAALLRSRRNRLKPKAATTSSGGGWFGDLFG